MNGHNDCNLKVYSFNNYSALMAVMAIQAARGRTTVIAMMSENSNIGQNGSNAQIKCDSFNKYEFCYTVADKKNATHKH